MSRGRPLDPNRSSRHRMTIELEGEVFEMIQGLCDKYGISKRIIFDTLIKAVDNPERVVLDQMLSEAKNLDEKSLSFILKKVDIAEVDEEERRHILEKIGI